MKVSEAIAELRRLKRNTHLYIDWYTEEAIVDRLREEGVTLSTEEFAQATNGIGRTWEAETFAVMPRLVEAQAEFEAYRKSLGRPVELIDHVSAHKAGLSIGAVQLLFQEALQNEMLQNGLLG